jgi:putative endonuclease
MQRWFVYTLKLNNGKYYVGCTEDLDKRINRCQEGRVVYTKVHLPVQLITFTVFFDKYKTYQFEKYLKSGSGRALAVNT